MEKSKTAEKNLKDKWVILDMIEVYTTDRIGEGMGETDGFVAPVKHKGGELG